MSIFNFDTTGIVVDNNNPDAFIRLPRLANVGSVLDNIHNPITYTLDNDVVHDIKEQERTWLYNPYMSDSSSLLWNILEKQYSSDNHINFIREHYPQFLDHHEDGLSVLPISTDVLNFDQDKFKGLKLGLPISLEKYKLNYLGSSEQLQSIPSRFSNLSPDSVHVSKRVPFLPSTRTPYTENYNTYPTINDDEVDMGQYAGETISVRKWISYIKTKVCQTYNAYWVATITITPDQIGSLESGDIVVNGKPLEFQKLRYGMKPIVKNFILYPHPYKGMNFFHISSSSLGSFRADIRIGIGFSEKNPYKGLSVVDAFLSDMDMSDTIFYSAYGTIFGDIYKVEKQGEETIIPVFNPDYEIDPRLRVMLYNNINGKSTKIKDLVLRDDVATDPRLQEYFSDTPLYKSIPLYNTTKVSKIEKYKNRSHAQMIESASSLILRTNPKLTGNIKLVVSKNELFLDTFKVSPILSERRFRKQRVSSFSNLSNDIRNVFSSVPSGELYKISDDAYNNHNISTDFSDQYDMTYSYGARTNKDELYSENYSILAPLWMGNRLPDHFSVFRVSSSDYQNIKRSSTNFLKEMLKVAVLVKDFDLRNSSAIGQYLHKHHQDIEYITGNIYLQFKEQDDPETPTHGENSWYGIAVDKGIVTQRVESSYFFNKVLTTSKHPNEEVNSYLVNGFERNKLVSPNLINLEFMFDDTEVGMLSSNHYFGLYLTENDFLEYKYISYLYDEKSKKYKLEKLDEDLETIDDRIVSTENGKLYNEKFRDKLIYAITPHNATRVKEPADISRVIKNYVVNRPHKNIVKTEIKNIPDFGQFKEFITMTLNKPLDVGDHIRIIVPNRYEDDHEWYIDSSGRVVKKKQSLKTTYIIDLVASDDISLTRDPNMVSLIPNITQQPINSFMTRVATMTKSEEDVTTNRNSRAMFAFRELHKGVSHLKQIALSKYTHNNQSTGYPDFINEDDIRYWRGDGLLSDYYTNIPVKHDPVGGTYPDDVLTSKDFFIYTQPKLLNTDFLNQSYNLYDVYTKNISEQTPIVYRMTFYAGEYRGDEWQSMGAVLTNKTMNKSDFKLASVVEQTERIKQALSKIPIAVYVRSHDKNTLGIVSEYENTVFQHILSPDADASRINDYSISFFKNDSIQPQPKMFYNSVNENHPKRLYAEPKSNIFFYLSPSDFFDMGNRFTYSISFAKISKHIYEIDLKNIDKIEYISLYKNIKGDYESINSFGIKTYYHETKMVNAVIDSEYTKTKEGIPIPLPRVVEVVQPIIGNSKLMAVQSPIHLDKFVISTKNDVDLNTPHNQFDLFSTYPLSLSIMGINPVTDIDYIGYPTTTKTLYDIETHYTFVFNKDTKITIGKEIPFNGIYKLIKGKFKDDIIKVGEEFSTFDIPDFKTTVHNISGELFVVEDAHIVDMRFYNRASTEQAPSKSPSKSVVSESLKVENFKNDTTNQLTTSLTTPSVFNFETIGSDIFSLRANFVADRLINKPIENYDIISNYSEQARPDNKMNVYDVIEYNGKRYTYKDFILHSSDNAPIHKFLSRHITPSYSLGYYNRHNKKFEFIIYGCKFILSVNDDNSIINLSKYNNYLVYMINTTNDNLDSGSGFDIIIDTNTKIIFIINYIGTTNVFRSSSLKRTDNTIRYNTDMLYKCTEFDFDIYDVDEVRRTLPYVNKTPLSEDDKANAVFGLKTTENSISSIAHLLKKNNTPISLAETIPVLHYDGEVKPSYFNDTTYYQINKTNIGYDTLSFRLGEKEKNSYLIDLVPSKAHITNDSRKLEKGERLSLLLNTEIPEEWKNYDCCRLLASDSEYIFHNGENQTNISTPNNIRFDKSIYFGGHLLGSRNTNGYMSPTIIGSERNKRSLIRRGFLLTEEEQLKNIHETDTPYRLKDLISDLSKQRIHIHIKDADGVTTLSDKDGSFRISVETPKNGVYNYGYFTPKRHELITFSQQDDLELSELIGMDLRQTNTNISSDKPIPLFYNRIYDKIEYDPTVIDTIALSERHSIVKSTWDVDYLKRFTKSNNIISTSSAISEGVEVPNFFGSKCISLKEKNSDEFSDVVLSKWDDVGLFTVEKIKTIEYDTSKTHTEYDALRVRLNLTKAFTQYALTTEAIYSDWKDNVVNKQMILSYIERILVNYYRIGHDMKLRIFRTPKTPSTTDVVRDNIVMIKPIDLNTRYTEVDNIQSEVVYEGGSYYYILTITDIDHNYYPQCTIRSVLSNKNK